MKQLLMITLLFITIFAKAQMGIGTTSPDASAKVDISSTTKGFLPPRMTAAQRTSISMPATGLMVYCADCGAGEPEYFNGSNWVNMVGGAAATPFAVGDAAFGGKIAYILVSTDPGYNKDVVHGLVAAVNDQTTNNGLEWNNGNDYSLIGATGTAIGTGLANTNKIIAFQGNTFSYAAKICTDYNGGGFTDWYLPSKDELNKLYLNRNLIGGFLLMSTQPYYWSSSENNSYAVWAADFYNGGTATLGDKSFSFFVRPIRNF